MRCHPLPSLVLCCGYLLRLLAAATAARTYCCRCCPVAAAATAHFVRVILLRDSDISSTRLPSAFSPRFVDSNDGDAAGSCCCFLTCVPGRKDSDSLISLRMKNLAATSLVCVDMLVMFSEGLVK